jgi:uncharacterized BrkB/YihY/UPF0761 family membrane protein
LKLPPPRRTLLGRLVGRLAQWVEHAHALRAGIERARGRSATLDATLDTVERDSQVGGGILAGALSYRLFVFALPLAFFLVSGLGVLASALGVDTHRIMNSVGLAGVVTKQVETASGSSSSWWAALISFLVLVVATRVLLRSVAIVHSLAWERSAASVKVTSRTLGIFAAVLVGQMALVGCVGAVDHQTPIGGILTLVASMFALAGLWLVVSLQVPHSSARWTDLVPGSLFYAIGFTGVVIFNILILGELIKSNSSTYGALGIAATLLLAFFFVGRVIVGAAVLNAALYERRLRSRDVTRADMRAAS